MKYLLFILSITLFSSCAQLSSFQTGKTLGKGNNMITVGAIGYGIKGEPGSVIEGDQAIFPHVEIMGQFGIAERLDLGVKLSSSANLQAYGKYQIAGNMKSKFAASLGGGFTYQFAGDDGTNIFRTHLPIYLSYHPGEKQAVYATPRFVYQFVSDDNNSYFLGSSLGFSNRFSENFTGFLEGSFYYPHTENVTTANTFLYQVGIGAGWNF